MKQITRTAALAVLMALGAAPAIGQETVAGETQNESAAQVYGWELMSDAERLEVREQMHAAATAEERRKLIQAHREEMQARAAKQGVTLREPRMHRSIPGRGPRQGAGKQGAGGRAQPAFADYDGNADGFISAEEFKFGHAERIKQRTEQGKMLRKAGTAPSFDDIDTDADGQLSAAEFEAHQTAERARRQRK